DGQLAAIHRRDIDAEISVARLIRDRPPEGDRLDPFGGARGRAERHGHRGDDRPEHGAAEPVADTHAASQNPVENAPLRLPHRHLQTAWQLLRSLPRPADAPPARYPE